MTDLKEVFKWVGYTILAIIAVGMVATGGLVFLLIGATIGTVIIGGLIVWFIAALIKTSWETSRSK